MGGRGSSSGIPDKGRKYGSQYHKVWEFENIKYVQRNPDAKEALMETRTPGRIYATVGGNDIIRITLFDSDNKRNKVIEKDKRSGEWHVHNGYNHWEYSEKRHNPLGSEDQKLLDKVNEAWKNRSKINGRTGILRA